MGKRLCCDQVNLYPTPHEIAILCYYAELGDNPIPSDAPTIKWKYLNWLIDLYGNTLQRWDLVTPHRVILDSFTDLSFYLEDTSDEEIQLPEKREGAMFVL